MMLRRTPTAIALLVLLASGAAWADDNATNTPVGHRVTLVEGGAFATSSQAYAIPLTTGTGLFGLGTAYKVDAGVQPNMVGGYTAGLGATVGVAPGKLGSDYSLRIGGGWAGDWSSSSPFNHLGVSELPTPSNDMSLSFTYNRAIMPGLSLTGTAEAYRAVGPSVLDPVGSGSQVVIGAGLGIRF